MVHTSAAGEKHKPGEKRTKPLFPEIVPTAGKVSLTMGSTAVAGASSCQAAGKDLLATEADEKSFEQQRAAEIEKRAREDADPNGIPRAAKEWKPGYQRYLEKKARRDRGEVDVMNDSIVDTQMVRSPSPPHKLRITNNASLTKNHLQTPPSYPNCMTSATFKICAQAEANVSRVATDAFQSISSAYENTESFIESVKNSWSLWTSLECVWWRQ